MKTCMECGQKFQPRRDDAMFCERRCKGEFANRRAVRGAELYDLFMAHRFDRKGAGKTLRLFSIMCRLAHHYRVEDGEKWQGFQSWVDPRKWLSNRPYLMVQHLGQMRIGRKAA